jgi:hypothetical protein
MANIFSSTLKVSVAAPSIVCAPAGSTVIVLRDDVFLININLPGTVVVTSGRFTVMPPPLVSTLNDSSVVTVKGLAATAVAASDIKNLAPTAVLTANTAVPSVKAVVGGVLVRSHPNS